MAWCPKCKNEFRDEFTVCDECGCPLVSYEDAMNPFVKTFTFQEESLCTKFAAYLTYCGIDNRTDVDEAQSESDTENAQEPSVSSFLISIRQDSLKQAKKAFHAFYLAEEQALKEQQTQEPPEYTDGANISAFTDEAVEDEEPVENESYHSVNTVYTPKRYQYKENRSTAMTFFVFSGFSLVMIILSLTNVLHFFDNPISLCMLAAICIGFFIIGCSSVSRAKKCLSQSVEEETFTQLLNRWLTDKFTQELIDSLYDDTLNEEFNYIALMDHCKKMIIEQFGPIDELYLDTILEEYYAKHFDSVHDEDD